MLLGTYIIREPDAKQDEQVDLSHEAWPARWRSLLQWWESGLREIGGVFLAALIVLDASDAPVGAHVGDFVFPIYELPSADLPDLHDHTLEDWDEVLPFNSFDTSYFRAYGLGPGHVTDTEDLSNLAVRFRMAWHSASSRIYFGVEFIDDVHVSDYDPWLLVEIDGDHSGGRYVYLDDAYSQSEQERLHQMQAQQYTIYPGERPLLGKVRKDWASVPPWSDIGSWRFGEAPTVVGLEFFLTPWDELLPGDSEGSRPSRLEPGGVIGFNVQVRDSDTPGMLSAVYTLVQPWAFEDVTYDGFSFSHAGFAENFADGELIPCYVGDCSRGGGTAVVQDSWGRIKAGLR